MNIDNHKLFYINLDHRKDRNDNFLNQINHINLLSNNIEKFSGIDGKKINLNQLPKNFVTEEGLKKVLNNTVGTLYIDLTYGSLGCALSHFTIYKKCIEENFDSVMIFEDDCINFSDNFDDYMKQIYELNFKTFDILYLGSYTPSRRIGLDSVIKTTNRAMRGGYAYLVTNRGAKYITQNIFPISYQFDGVLNTYTKKNKLKTLYFDPHIVYTDLSSTSDNQGVYGLKKDL